MTLDIACAGAGLVVLCLILPIARRAMVCHYPHAVLTIVAVGVAYVSLTAIFVIDVAFREPLPATLRFARGFVVGLAIGLLIGAGALWIYDVARRRFASRRWRAPD